MSAFFHCRDNSISLLGELLFILCAVSISFRLFSYLLCCLVNDFIAYLGFNCFNELILTETRGS